MKIILFLAVFKFLINKLFIKIISLAYKLYNLVEFNKFLSKQYKFFVFVLK